MTTQPPSRSLSDLLLIGCVAGGIITLHLNMNRVTETIQRLEARMVPQRVRRPRPPPRVEESEEEEDPPPSVSKMEPVVEEDDE